jgi:hypothetical protein
MILLVVAIAFLAGFFYLLKLLEPKVVVPFHQTPRYEEVLKVYGESTPAVGFRIYCVFAYLKSPSEFLTDPYAVVKAKQLYEMGHQMRFEIEPWVTAIVRSRDLGIGIGWSSRSSFTPAYKVPELVWGWALETVVHHDPTVKFKGEDLQH